MKKLIKSFLVSIILLPVCVNAGNTLMKVAEKNPGKTLAIVSISANNYGDSLQGWNSADTTQLMKDKMNDLLNAAETIFATDWKVINASTFVEKPEYQALAGEQREVGMPFINNKPMPLFSKNRKQMIKATSDKDTLQALAKVTGADFVMIIYSEWAVATGKFVPTTKALTKNVIGMYDANGKEVYSGRLDELGPKPIGAVGFAAVNSESIVQWVLAYESAIRKLYNAGRK